MIGMSASAHFTNDIGQYKIDIIFLIFSLEKVNLEGPTQICTYVNIFKNF